MGFNNNGGGSVQDGVCRGINRPIFNASTDFANADFNTANGGNKYPAGDCAADNTDSTVAGAADNGDFASAGAADFRNRSSGGAADNGSIASNNRTDSAAYTSDNADYNINPASHY